MRRSGIVPGEVTAGLDTVAIRVPAHPIAHALIAAAALPVAAPSANLFSRPSPTQAAHVLDDLAGRIDLLIDGGATSVGVESTVLDLASDIPTILRPGAVTVEMLRPILPNVRLRQEESDDTAAQRAPGLLSRHYSPRAPLTLYEGPAADVLARLRDDAAAATRAGQWVGLLLADDDVCDVVGARIVRVGPETDLDEVAARLYAALRELDRADVDVILARGLPAAGGMAAAISDRLRRAAAGRILRCGS
jgi:L-threonylcarbamoyladenylate synthase